jgi:hypothetical protein
MKLKYSLPTISIARLVFVVLVSPVLMFLFLAFPVHAASITLTPPSGTVGTPVTLTGEKFAGRLASIFWDKQLLAKGIPISESGNINYTLVIPPAVKGEHSIFITDDSNWATSTASFSYVVTPGLKIFPSSGKQQTQITIAGTGFTSLEKEIRIVWDGSVTTHAPSSADKFGSWDTSFIVPGTNKGEHIIGASGSSTTAAEVNKIPFIVYPWIKVSPTSGTVGTRISIYGWGFRQNEDGVTISWDGDIIVTNIRAETDGTIIIDGSKRTSGMAMQGSDTYESVFVPPTTSGKHILVVYGSSFTPKGVLPETVFEVLPQISIQPTSGNKGTQVTVSGAGFAGGENVNISFDGIPVATKIRANDNGSYEAIFSAPQGKNKENKITASGDKGNSAQTNFTTERVILGGPQLIYPERGAKLAIFDSLGSVVGGSAKYLIGLFDYLNGQKSEVSNLLINFSWSKFNEPATLSYNLQISKDSRFSSFNVDKRDIKNNSTLLAKDTNFTAGRYYWRVRSIDNAGSEGDWSDIGDFEIISMPPLVTTFTIIIVVLIIAAIVFGILTIWSNLRRM